MLHCLNILAACCVVVLTMQATEASADEKPKAHETASHVQEWDEWTLTLEQGCRLYVREIGRGPVVLVLHGGWGAEHSYMVDAIMPLKDRFRFVLYDQRGSLRSRCDSAISVSRHVEDVEALRIALDCDSLVILAHSMGGYLAMAYAERHPDRLAGLVLTGSAPALGTTDDLTSRLMEPTLRRWERPETQQVLRENGISRELHRNLHPMLKEDCSEQATARQRSYWHRITFAAINLHYVDRWRQLRGSLFFSEQAGGKAAASMPEQWDFTGVLAALSCPILVIHGDDDYLPLHLHRRWLPSVENARLEVLNDAGHVLWIDQPEAFSRLLGRYLDDRLQ